MLVLECKKVDIPVKDEKISSAYSFRELHWDTEFFGISCAKAILHKPLSRIEWETLRDKFYDYQFISFENRYSESVNALYIGKETTAFLADVNIQFKKKVDTTCNMPKGVKIYQFMGRDDRILEMANFPFSKFTEDQGLAKRGGADVYRHWLINSFSKPGKYYAIDEGIDSEINGYLLHSYLNKTCTVELIAVSRNKTKGGIGMNLMKAVEYLACQHGCDELKVGTQVRNLEAINFYHKCGFRQVESYQVYHLWNL